jgi:TPR repeat protein
MLYFIGRGVPLDYVSAYMWLGRSAAAGDPLAAQSLKTVAAIMTPHQKLLALAQLGNPQGAGIATGQQQSLFTAGGIENQ